MSFRAEASSFRTGAAYAGHNNDFFLYVVTIPTPINSMKMVDGNSMIKDLWESFNVGAGAVPFRTEAAYYEQHYLWTRTAQTVIASLRIQV